MPVIEQFLREPFSEIAAILFIAAIVGGVATLLRQPLIVAFIAVGIICGPAWLDIVQESEPIELLSSLGIAILLFVVGLRLDLNVIRTMGPVALATGLGQVAFTSLVGYAICIGLGYSNVVSIYIAIALTFSSTIIIVKLLSDKREIDALHGRIAVGFLIVQDIMVVLMMIAISSFGTSAGQETAITHVVAVIGKGLGMLALVALLAKFVLPRLTHQMAKHQELLLLFAIAWATLLAAVGEYAGFSREVGAFLAGVSLASTPFRESISGRLTSLRDFLLLFFFIRLGASLELNQISQHLWQAVALSLFVLIGNPLIVMVIMGAMGYRRRTGFLAGLTVAQISEFSLILGALGISVGHISSDTLGLITLVGLITIGLSTYMILYSHPSFERLSPLLRIFEKKSPYRETGKEELDRLEVDAIVFGLGRFGNNIARQLQQHGTRVLGVDFDPQVVQTWHNEGRWVQYGDAEDPDFAATLPLERAQWVISTIPQLHISKTLLHALQHGGFRCNVVLTAHNAHDARVLKEAGTTIVLLPFVDAAEQAVSLIVSRKLQTQQSSRFESHTE